MNKKMCAMLAAALLVLSGVFVYTTSFEQVKVAKLVDLLFAPSVENIVRPGIDGGDSGKGH